MAECTVCGAATRVSDACPHCARSVCADHRPPGSHDCPGVDADETGGWFTDPDAGRSAAATAGAELSDPRRLGVGLLVVAVLAVVIAGAFVAAGGASVDLDPERAAGLIEERANDARTARGLAPLAADGDLATVAAGHSAHMAATGYVDHTRRDGTTISDRYAAAGIDCRGGENIYVAPNGGLLVTESAVATAAVRAWLDSPGHRSALLNPAYERQGVGVAVSASGAIYVTQNFC